MSAKHPDLMERSKFHITSSESAEKCAKRSRKRVAELKKEGFQFDSPFGEQLKPRFLGVIPVSEDRWQAFGLVDGNRRLLAIGNSDKECAKNARNECERLLKSGHAVAEEYGKHLSVILSIFLKSFQHEF